MPSRWGLGSVLWLERHQPGEEACNSQGNLSVAPYRIATGASMREVRAHTPPPPWALASNGQASAVSLLWVSLLVEVMTRNDTLSLAFASPQSWTGQSDPCQLCGGSQTSSKTTRT